MRCQRCQKNVGENDNFCRHCGHRLDISGDDFSRAGEKRGVYSEYSENPVLKVDQPIKIELTGRNIDEENDRYDSRIVDMDEEKILALAPFHRGKPLEFEEGENVSIFFTEGSAAYRFSTQVLESISQPVPGLALSRPDPEKVKKLQRRDYFRLEVERRAYYRPINKFDEPLQGGYEKTHTLEISGGGAKIIMFDVNEDDIGQRFEVKLDVPPLEDKGLKAKLANLYEEAEEGPGREAGLEFFDLHYEDRDALMGWLFERQRRMREKGLI